MKKILELKKVCKTYNPNTKIEVKALIDIDLSINKGEFLVIMGPSGSGKTTLLNMISTVKEPTSGKVLFNGESIFHMNEEDKAKYRYQELSFVFQDFNLLTSMTIKENIELPLMMNHVNREKREEYIHSIVKNLNIESILNKYTVECSGGQLQRVAIARAIATNSPIIICDEPTGNLDSENGKEIMEILVDLNNMGTTIILVTHDSYMASFGKRVIYIEDGMIEKELLKNDLSNEVFYKEIVKDVLRHH